MSAITQKHFRTTLSSDEFSLLPFPSLPWDILLAEISHPFLCLLPNPSNCRPASPFTTMQLLNQIFLALAAIPAVHHMAVAAPIANVEGSALQFRGIGMNGVPDLLFVKGGMIAVRNPGLNSKPYWHHGLDIQGGPGETFESDPDDVESVVVDIPDFVFDPAAPPDE
jgi:hypothetical protein